jgi:hypothetical protein
MPTLSVHLLCAPDDPRAAELLVALRSFGVQAKSTWSECASNLAATATLILDGGGPPSALAVARSTERPILAAYLDQPPLDVARQVVRRLIEVAPPGPFAYHLEPEVSPGEWRAPAALAPFPTWTLRHRAGAPPALDRLRETAALATRARQPTELHFTTSPDPRTAAAFGSVFGAEPNQTRVVHDGLHEWRDPPQRRRRHPCRAPALVSARKASAELLHVGLALHVEAAVAHGARRSASVFHLDTSPTLAANPTDILDAVEAFADERRSRRLPLLIAWTAPTALLALAAGRIHQHRCPSWSVVDVGEP